MAKTHPPYAPEHRHPTVEPVRSDRRCGAFCFGEVPTLGDVCLVPQVESARRFRVAPADLPLIDAVDKACAEINALRLAALAMYLDAARAALPKMTPEIRE